MPLRGGYRAMVFHLGALWRLNDAGWLPRLNRISSVSGGSITAAVLGMAWDRLLFDGNGVAANFDDTVVAEVHTVASKTIDFGSVLGGILSPESVPDRVDTRRPRNASGFPAGSDDGHVLALQPPEVIRREALVMTRRSRARS